jgi:hypothetical protein
MSQENVEARGKVVRHVGYPDASPALEAGLSE